MSGQCNVLDDKRTVRSVHTHYIVCIHTAYAAYTLHSCVHAVCNKRCSVHSVQLHSEIHCRTLTDTMHFAMGSVQSKCMLTCYTYSVG